MNKKKFLGEKGFVKVKKGKWKRGRDGNDERLDLDSMSVHVHDEHGRFVEVPQELHDILKVVERMEDMNQKQLDEWIDGLGKSDEQLSLSDFFED